MTASSTTTLLTCSSEGSSYMVSSSTLSRMVRRPRAPVLRFNARLAIAVSASGRNSISWAEAAGYPLCLLTQDMQNRRILNQIFREIGITPVPKLETNSFDGIASHVRHGDWCSILPHTYFRVFGMFDNIQAIPLVDPIRTQSVGLVTTDRDPLPPVTDAFLAFAASLDLDSDLRL